VQAVGNALKNTLIFFSFGVPWILQAATEGCAFCDWLLDDQWIHRSGTVNRYISIIGPTPPPDDPSREAHDAIIEAAIQVDPEFPAANPNNSLRHLIKGDRKIFENLTLAAEAHNGPGALIDIIELRSFILWDSSAEHVVYRSRHGFNVFTTSGKFNSISRTIFLLSEEKRLNSS
jgi:hypothetical protein